MKKNKNQNSLAFFPSLAGLADGVLEAQTWGGLLLNDFFYFQAWARNSLLSSLIESLRV